MNEEVRKISQKILEFLCCDDASVRANVMVDCATEDELPIVLLGLVDSDQEVRLIAADVIGLRPHRFTEAKELLKKLYVNEEDDEVKINILGTLKKWDEIEIAGKDIMDEFYKLIKDKDEAFVQWAELKLRIKESRGGT